MKLRTSILSLVLAVVVPLATVSILLVYTLFQHGQEAARRAATDRVRAVMTAIDAKLLGAIGTVEALAVSPALRSGDLNAFYRQASEIVRAQPDWSAITLSTPSGEQLVNTLRPLGYKLPPVPHHDGMIEPVTAPKAVVGDVIKVPLLNDYVVPIRVPVVLPDGVPYMVRAGIRLSAFQRIIEAQHLQADEVLGLVDSTGRFVARVPPRPPAAMASPDFLEHARASESGWYRGLTVEGKDTFTAYTRSAQSGWMLGHALPLFSVYQPGVRAGAILAGGVVIVLAIALLLAFWIARRIIEPVQALGRAAQALGRNDAPTPAADGGRAPAASPLLAASGRIDELREVERLLSQASDAVHERQELLAREARALQASDKAKTEFLAMLSHELRNPLAALVSASALLRRVAVRDGTFEFARRDRAPDRADEAADRRPARHQQPRRGQNHPAPRARRPGRTGAAARRHLASLGAHEGPRACGRGREPVGERGRRAPGAGAVQPAGQRREVLARRQPHRIARARRRAVGGDQRQGLRRRFHGA